MAGKRKTMGDALASMKAMQPPARAQPDQDIESSIEGGAAPEAVRSTAAEADPDAPPQPAEGKKPVVGTPITKAMRDAVRGIVTFESPTARAIAARMSARAETPPVSARARSHVEKERLARETKPAKVPRGYNVRPPRIEKPHQSVYADPAVWKVIRQIAVTEDVKPQDLYREGLRHVLKRRGFDFDKLDSGEA